MGGGSVFGCWVRFTVDFICGVGACARVGSGGYSGSLGGYRE